MSSRGLRLSDYKTGASRPADGRWKEPGLLGHGENHQHFIARMKMDLKVAIQRKKNKEQSLDAAVITQEEIDRAKHEFYKT